MEPVTREEILEIAEHCKELPIYPHEFWRSRGSLYYRFMRLLCMRTLPELSVELGVQTACGSLHMALGNPNGHVYGVDISNKYPRHVNYTAAACPNFEFIESDSIQAVSEIKTGMVQKFFSDICIIHFDSEHTYEYLKSEYSAYRPLVMKGGVMMFDDTIYKDGVAKFLSETFNDEERISMEFLHPQVGFEVVIAE